MAKKKGGKGGLGVFEGMRNKHNSSDSTGVKDQKEYPSVDSFSKRSETAATPASLEGRKY